MLVINYEEAGEINNGASMLGTRRLYKECGGSLCPRRRQSLRCIVAWRKDSKLCSVFLWEKEGKLHTLLIPL